MDRAVCMLPDPVAIGAVPSIQVLRAFWAPPDRQFTTGKLAALAYLRVRSRSVSYPLRAVRCAGSRPHLASGCQGSWKIATIHASSGVIWGMSADA
jgi:hypothetical protein